MAKNQEISKLIAMDKRIKTFLLGIAAGAAIGLGGLLFAICHSFGLKALGSVLFAVGLTLVCTLKLFLYTGKIGYLVGNDSKKEYIISLIIGIIGNAIGAIAFGLLTQVIVKSINAEALLKSIQSIVNVRRIDLGKGGIAWYTPLVTSFFCGMLVHIAVYVFKTKMNIVFRLIFLVLCVFVFVYCGFEHCIANMFYFSFGGAFDLQIVLNIILTILGNSVGALLLNYVLILSRK